MGKTDCGGNSLVLMGGAMLSKSLIRFSVDGWGCVPSLLFDLRPNYGGGNEHNGDLLQKVPFTHCHTQWPCSRPPPTHTSAGDSCTLTGKSGPVSCGVTDPFSFLTMNKVSGGDGIPAKLLQILKDDAMKVLHSICQQIWKTQQWPQDWKRSVFIPIPTKGNPIECSKYHITALISHSSKVMLKILQASLQQYLNSELLDIQAGFRKGRGTRDQIANIHLTIKKSKRVPEKHLLLLYWLCQSLWLCGSQQTVENS